MATPKKSIKRTYTRLDFSAEQEEQIIEFVKTNPVLINPKDPNFKNKMYRDRMWNEFGEKINKTGNHSTCYII